MEGIFNIYRADANLGDNLVTNALGLGVMSQWSAVPEYETIISESALKVEINARRIE